MQSGTCKHAMGIVVTIFVLLTPGSAFGFAFPKKPFVAAGTQQEGNAISGTTPHERIFVLRQPRRDLKMRTETVASAQGYSHNPNQHKIFVHRNKTKQKQQKNVDNDLHVDDHGVRPTLDCHDQSCTW